MLIPEGFAAALSARLILLGRLVHLDDHVGILGIPYSIALDDLHQQPTAGNHVLRIPQSHATHVLLHVVLCEL